ncbi:MAG: sulfite exporter TauE/SafE family protein [Pseudolabrys sp.]|nr:sulfite exporter TauE/SafE family protein [Pseudolabrys sp.]
MNELRQLLETITELTPYTIGLVALAGLIVGVAPGSFPLLSVAAGLSTGQGASEVKSQRPNGLWLSAGFALGIMTVDAVLGALFGLLGLAVLQVLVSFLGLAYVLLAIILTIIGLALLRVIHIVIPMLSPSANSTKTFIGSYLLGLPFGLSACPACTPLMLPVVAAAAVTADPLVGAAFMLTFGLARGIPIVLVGTVAGSLAHLRHTGTFTRSVERLGGVLMLAAAAYFFYQAAIYAGWLAP